MFLKLNTNCAGKMNKRGLIKNSIILLAIALTILSILMLTKYVSAGKADQYYIGDNTCEQFIDSILWTAQSSKSAVANVYYNWTPGNPCGSTKGCDIISIDNYIRYINPSAKTGAAGHSYVRIANRTESATGTFSRYSAYLNNSMIAGDVLGPRWECGNEPPGQTENTCDTTGEGYDTSGINYSVHAYALGGSAATAYYITDAFNVRYDWCWTPLIYDATVTPEVGVYSEDTFTFTINVTNPGANTTIRLLTRTIGGSWSQEGSAQYCFDCAQEKLSFNVNFGSSADREFKFNATDNESYTTEAGNPSTLGTATNECLDSGNDCIFEVNEPSVAEGTPTLEDEAANGQTSGATEGWGSNWTFVVNVSNPAQGAGDIELNLSIDSGAGFVIKESQTCTDPCSTSTKFTFYVDDFMCTDISSAQYRFSATNLNGTSTVTHPFTIEKDDTIIEYIQGNNTIANRSGSQTQLFIMRINDTDNGQVIDNQNVTFEVTYNSVDYSAVNNLSNSSGQKWISMDSNREWVKSSGYQDKYY